MNKHANYIVAIMVFLLLATRLNAQFADDFTDGDFIQNPSWTGDTGLFRIHNLQLRLNSTGGNDSTYLVTPSQILDDTEWNFWVRLAFTPSDNNHPKIYLVSNSANLRGPLNGYYIQIGKTGTNNKRIYFFRQTGTQRIELMAGADNLATGSNNLLRIKVTRNNNGDWQFFADPQGGHLFAFQGSVSDATHSNATHFGIFCKYTSSNATRFYFDDFYVGGIQVDTIPPVVSNITALNQTSIEIVFSETVEPGTATNTSNYYVPGIGNPLSVIHDSNNPARILLQFGQAFANGQFYTLQVQGVSDFAGNIMLAVGLEFSFYKAALFDIVINEIMADPTPGVGLPPYEYIELFNKTAFAINLSGWVFEHGTTQRDFPAVSIPAYGHLILGTEAATSALAQYGAVATIAGLSSTALTNAGTTLSILDPDRTVVHAANYSDDWYQNNIKKEGGWSLEMIDPNNPCGEGNNWIASKNLSGGTPGMENSVKAINPDETSPWIAKAVLSNVNSVMVYFSEKLDQAAISNPSNFQVSPGFGVPLYVIPNEPVFNSVNLVYPFLFERQVIYEVSVSDQLADCTGNTIEPGSKARFAFAEYPEHEDIVINEILFNPPADGAEYVEIYNRSQKIIDLKNVRLSSQDTILNQLTSVCEIVTDGHLIFPGDYLVLTTNPDLVKSYFQTTNPRGFIKMESIPQFANTSGIAVLSDPNEIVLDRIIYTEGMHFPMLNTVKGVALERIDFNRPASDPTNWLSASSSSGYGTPAYRNSQFMAAQPANDPFVISPEIFSPDNDGHNDVLSISYNFQEPGNVATIIIYDAAGRLVRRLVHNQLLGSAASFTWNGITDDNQKAGIGYYLIMIEVFDLNGNIRRHKKTTVLAGRL